MCPCSGETSEDNNPEKNMGNRGVARWFLEGNEDFARNGKRGHSCAILAKHLSALCQYPENLHAAKPKSHGLISLAEETEREYNTGSRPVILTQVMTGTSEAQGT